MEEPTIPAATLDDILRSSASAERRLRQIRALVRAALRPLDAPPKPVEHDAGGWPLLPDAGAYDTGTMFYSPPDPPAERSTAWERHDDPTA